MAFPTIARGPGKQYRTWYWGESSGRKGTPVDLETYCLTTLSRSGAWDEQIDKQTKTDTVTSQPHFYLTLRLWKSLGQIFLASAY